LTRKENAGSLLDTFFRSTEPWASAHRGKWGQLIPPGKMDEKLKSENMQQREQSGQAGVENGAMLTTYLFRYTSKCTIS